MSRPYSGLSIEEDFKPSAHYVMNMNYSFWDQIGQV